MLNAAESLAIAEQMLEKLRRDAGEEVMIKTAVTRETERSWVYFYNTRVFLETGSFSHALVGNGPIVVDKSDGTVRWGRTDIPIEDQLASW